MAAMTIVGSLFQNPSHDPAGLLFRSMKCTFLEYAIANTKKSSNFLSSSFIKEGSKATCRRCFWLIPSLLTKNFKLSEKLDMTSVKHVNGQVIYQFRLGCKSDRRSKTGCWCFVSQT